ncbi:MAG: hypothetical protein R2867_24425 [Caldilineaceae bacterium]
MATILVADWRDLTLRCIENWIFNFIRQRYTARTVGDVVLALRKDAFDAVLARDMSFYDEFSSGRICGQVHFRYPDFSNVGHVDLEFDESVAAGGDHRWCALYSPYCG